MHRLALALALLPFLVSAVALVVDVGGAWMPTGDHAGTELQVRDIGHHAVLVGLWSRANWSHPGPMLFYLLAPFYWLTGRASIGLSIGALAINGAAVAGMAIVARRRGGVPLLLCTLLGCTLMMRTLGADFLHDPQNIFIPTLPFALLVFLTWAMASGEAWALPAGAFVATFLAQTHVGFVPIAGPLLAFGATLMVVSIMRSHRPDARRELARAGALAVGVLAVLWLPPLLDVAFNSPSNIQTIVQWFANPHGGAHTLGEGWRVITGQFGFPPESLTTKRAAAFVTGESAMLHSAPVPILLVPATIAAAFLWRRRHDGRALVATLTLTLLLGIVAIAQTVGPAFDYRLRWTWVPALVAFVATAWAGWLAAARRWGRRAERVLTGAVLSVLLVVAGINMFTAATAGGPHPDDSALIAALMPKVVKAVAAIEAGKDRNADISGGAGGGGTVVVSDPLTQGRWYGRAILLQLERRGINARVDAGDAILYGASRVQPGGPATRLLVLRDEFIAQRGNQSRLRLIAEATSPWKIAEARVAGPLAELEAKWKAGQLSNAAYLKAASEIHVPSPKGQSFAGRVAVFLDNRLPERR